MFYLLNLFIQMKILINNSDLNEALKGDTNLGFVPTMGSIHKGHLSLIKKSKKITNKTIVSIFVNPRQFNNKKDYKNYPKNIKKDIKILKKIKVDYLYIPKIKSVFGKNKKQKIHISRNNRILCAKFRKGHFEGVLQVMDRLTYLIKPNKIFMGEKDYQQLLLVKNFIEKKYKSKIVSCKTIREKNNLALSSRNSLLNNQNFIVGNKIATNLIKFKRSLKNKKNLRNLIINKKYELEKNFKIKVNYLELRKKKDLKNSKNLTNSKLFIAYYIGDIRLIDNF